MRSIIGPMEFVITEDGFYPLEPGDYEALGRLDGVPVTDVVPFTIPECPGPTATPRPTGTPGPTPTPGLGVGGAGSICDGDVPYLAYRIDLTGTGITDDTVDIRWINPSGPDVVYRDQPLVGRVLWPGAVVGPNGEPLDWPGWRLVNGVWVEGDRYNWVRPSVQVRFTVNPSRTLTFGYPPSRPSCLTNPPRTKLPPTDGLPDTSTAEGTEAAHPWAAFLLAMVLLGGISVAVAVAYRRRPSL